MSVTSKTQTTEHMNPPQATHGSRPTRIPHEEQQLPLYPSPPPSTSSTQTREASRDFNDRGGGPRELLSPPTCKASGGLSARATDVADGADLGSSQRLVTGHGEGHLGCWALDRHTGRSCGDGGAAGGGNPESAPRSTDRLSLPPSGAALTPPTQALHGPPRNRLQPPPPSPSRPRKDA